MLKIIAETSSSGTGNAPMSVSPLFQEPAVSVGVWNTAEIAFVHPAAGQSPRPLSAIADLAVDLGPADLSTTFRARSEH